MSNKVVFDAEFLQNVSTHCSQTVNEVMIAHPRVTGEEYRFSFQQVTKMTGVSFPTIKGLEEKGLISPIPVNEHGQRLGLLIDDINDLRRLQKKMLPRVMAREFLHLADPLRLHLTQSYSDAYVARLYKTFRYTKRTYNSIKPFFGDWLTPERYNIMCKNIDLGSDPKTRSEMIKLGLPPQLLPLCPVASATNFKGGTSKTTSNLHLAHHYVFNKGARVLYIDLDPQASSTLFQGVIPDVEYTLEDTIMGHLRDNIPLKDLVLNSHIDNLDYIPSCVEMTDGEMLATADLGSESGRKKMDTLWYTLRDSLATLREEYDLIVVDTPPSLGWLSTMLLPALTHVFVTAQATIVDYASTVQFFNNLANRVKMVSPNQEYEAVRLLVTRYLAGRGKATESIYNLYRRNFPPEMLMTHPFKESENLKMHAQDFGTVFELPKAYSDANQYNDTFKVFEEIFEVIESRYEESDDSTDLAEAFV